MEQDDIGLNPQCHQVRHPTLEVLEKCRVELAEVERPASGGFSRPYTNEVPGTGATGQTGKGIKRWFILIKEVVFWEDAHAQFIERCAAQRCQCLLLKLVALMHPGVAGGTDLFVGRS